MDILDSFEKLSIKDTNNKPQNKKREARHELRAECKEMCSSEEVAMRIKNKLVHALEKRIVKYVPPSILNKSLFKMIIYGLLNSSKLEYNLVKEYSRPAAGKVIKSSDLRTIDTLVRTTNYLIKEYVEILSIYFVKYNYSFEQF
jgi:hypothetical protein